MNSSVHIDNKKNFTLILGKGPTQRLDGTTLAAEKMFSINTGRLGAQKLTPKFLSNKQKKMLKNVKKNL